MKTEFEEREEDPETQSQSLRGSFHEPEHNFAGYASGEIAETGSDLAMEQNVEFPIEIGTNPPLDHTQSCSIKRRRRLADQHREVNKRQRTLSIQPFNEESSLLSQVPLMDADSWISLVKWMPWLEPLVFELTSAVGSIWFVFLSLEDWVQALEDLRQNHENLSHLFDRRVQERLKGQRCFKIQRGCCNLNVLSRYDGWGITLIRHSLETAEDSDIDRHPFGEHLTALGSIGHAVQKQDIVLFQLLIQHGADVNCHGSFRRMSEKLKERLHIQPYASSIHCPLIAALEDGNEVFARLLIRHNASFDDNCHSCDCTDGILQTAIRNCSDEFVLWLIDQGANVNQNRVLTHFVGDTPLTVALKHRRESVAQYLIRHGAIFDPSSFQTMPSPIHIALKSCSEDFFRGLAPQSNPTTGDQTLEDFLRASLHVAVLERSISHIRLLIKLGADVNRVYDGKTLLGMALTQGSEPIMRCLMLNGASIQRAMKLFRAEYSPIECDIIIKLLKEQWKHLLQEATTVRKNLRMLRLTFGEQHTVIMAASQRAEDGNSTNDFGEAYRTASSYAEFAELPACAGSLGSWSLALDKEQAKAWNTGFDSLRRLCDAKLPGGLNEVIMFLGLAKAMSEIIGKQDIESHQAMFLMDLGRWEILFHTEPHLLRLFRLAIRAIWDVDTEQDPGQCIDLACLDIEGFQEMALNLVSHMDHALGLEVGSEMSLMATQAPWTDQLPNHDAQLSQSQTSLPTQNGVDQQELVAGGTPSLPSTANLPHFPDWGLDQSGAYFEVAKGPQIVFHLLTGAIFSMVLAFILGKSKNTPADAYVNPLMRTTSHIT